MMGHFGTLRARITAGAVVVVGVMLAATGVLLVEELHRGLIHDTDVVARAIADDVASGVGNNTLAEILKEPRRDDTLIQVVNEHGKVIAASPNAKGLRRVVTFEPDGRLAEARTFHNIPVEDGAFRIVARFVKKGATRDVIYVAHGLESVERSTDRLVTLLLIGLPILLGLMGTMIWLIVGWALQPVEAMRTEVESIGGGDLHRRVPEPTTRDEIGRLARTMNMMLGRLESSADSQRRFVADASHELRNPLAGMRAQLEVDLAHPERANWLETEREALDNTVRLQRLVDDLLVLAEHDAKGTAHRESVDLDDIVLAEARRLRANTAHTVDTAGVSGAQLVGNPDQLSRAVRNLLDNADRYATSMITIELAELGDAVVLTVTDDGPGIPEAERARVFERFARVDDARAGSNGGAGLGLAITRDVVTAHGGTIDVANRPGASFTLTFPARREATHI
jgi:signal transduction histidine kinase